MSIVERGLRNHIPIAGPATREPMDGTEPYLRLSLGFTPRWYRDKLGVDFSKRWHTDPAYRYETLVQMKVYLHEQFPSIENFKPTFDNGIEHSCGTISGVYGAMLIALIYDLDVVYADDGWPAANPNYTLSEGQIMNLEPFDVQSNPVVLQLIEQMDYIQAHYGAVHGYVNYQGVLNNALRIRGQEIFLDMMDNPELAHKLFRHITDTMVSVAKLIQKKQRDSGFCVNFISNSNCVINMISAKLYEEFLFQYDEQMAGEFERFGIHTCNWKADKYFDSLAKFGDKLGYLDTGACSDLQRMKELFTDTRRAVLVSPVEFANRPIGELKAQAAEICSALAPCDIVLADVDSEVPNDKVRDYIDFVRLLSDAKGAL